MGQDRPLTRCNRTVAVRERLLALALLAAAPSLAQNAELSGLITDPTGLAVHGARVVVQRATTGATRSVSSNEQGEYSVPALLPGPYDIAVEANGVKSVHQNGVVVEVDQRARLDFALIVGSATETTTVQGSVPLLNASDASVSTLIGNRFVENLPLNGRSFSSLIDLTPGVVLTPTNSYKQGKPETAPGGPVSSRLFPRSESRCLRHCCAAAPEPAEPAGWRIPEGNMARH